MINLARIPGAWRTETDDLPRPDWEVIGAWIERHFPGEEKWDDVYSYASRQWLETLAEHLEGEYHIVESPGFILLSTLPLREANSVVRFCEAAEKLYSTELPEVAQIYGCGPEAILIFEELDDYARYIAHYYPDEEAAQYMGTGVHLRDPWNPHIALVRQHPHSQIESTLAHELVHAALGARELPRWLDEGLAMRLERMLLSGTPEPYLDAEIAQRHRHYWTAERIQDFWTGASFLVPGKSSERSYLLADVLVSTIARNSAYLCDFVAAAAWEDSGQSAAREHLGLSLGEIAALFLGEGEWDPAEQERTGK